MDDSPDTDTTPTQLQPTSTNGGSSAQRAQPKRIRPRPYNARPPVCEDCDWERWQRAARMMAEQANECVEIMVCVQGACTQIGTICPQGTDDVE